MNRLEGGNKQHDLILRSRTFVSMEVLDGQINAIWHVQTGTGALRLINRAGLRNIEAAQTAEDARLPTNRA